MNYQIFMFEMDHRTAYIISGGENTYTEFEKWQNACAIIDLTKNDGPFKVAMNKFEIKKISLKPIKKRSR